MPDLTPRKLVRDFGALSDLAAATTLTLRDILTDDSHEYQLWLKHNQHHLSNQKLPALFEQAGTPPLVFATQTYYALVMKLLLVHALRLTPHIARVDAYCSQVENDALFECIGLKQLFGRTVYSWYLNHLDERLCPCIWQMIETIQRYSFSDPPPDTLKALHHHLFPIQFRHALGETYTPDWLAHHLLLRLDYTPEQRLLDPACGTGTFLALAAQRLKAAGSPLKHILGQIAGIDINPLAVMSAKINLILSLLDDFRANREPLTLPIYQADSILDPPELGAFHIIAGNPPWINWESLPDDYRETSRGLWQQYGLFPHMGMDTILGKGKKDLAMLMTYAAADHYLAMGGKLGFIISEPTLKAPDAGEGFRRFQIGDVPLCVLHVDDLTHIKPFKGIMTRAALLVLQKGKATCYPVPYTLWKKTAYGKALLTNSPLDVIKSRTRRIELVAGPMVSDDLASVWISGKPEALAAVRKLFGSSPYQAHAGAYTGGANAVYWLNVLEQRGDRLLIRNIIAGAKRPVAQVEAEIEAQFVYPLLRGTDVQRWIATPGAAILMVQNPTQRQGYAEDWLRTCYPLTYAYLKQFEDMLCQRAAYKRYFKANAPFYSMFDVGDYTLSPIKVIWQGLGRREMRAAVVNTGADKPLICNQAMHPFIALTDADEAHFLAACLNSAPFEFAVISHTQYGGKSFAQPGILKRLNLPQYNPHAPLHQQLSHYSRQAHIAVQNGDSPTAIEQQIHALAASLWGLTDREWQDVQHSLVEIQS